MPSQTFVHTARTAAGRGQAWEALQQASTWAAMGGIDQVDGVHRDDRGHLLGYHFTAAVGGVHHRGEARTLEAHPTEWMTVGIESAEMSGEIRIDLHATGDGTELTVTITARSKGFISTIAFPVISAAIGRELPRSVEAFARSLDDPGA